MSLFESTSQDIRYALRMMKGSAGFTVVAILSLALGIGATIAIFSVIYALTLRPLPVERPEQLVQVLGVLGEDLHTYAEWKIFRERQDIFSGVFAYNHSDIYFHLVNAKQQQDLEGFYVSGDYFSTLGVSTVLGRPLQAADDQPGAPPVCVIGYGLWRRWYGQSRDVLGQTIRANGNEFVIVGVAPKSFFGVDIGDIPEIFMPLETERTYKDYPIRYGHQTPSLDDPATIISIAARLKPGISTNQANAGLQVLGAEIYSALTSRPDGNKWHRAAPKSLSARSMQNGTSHEWLQDMDVVVLLMIMAAVALIIACANLGNLLLARGAKRRSEIATRLAIGASRWRLVRQLLTESVALSAAGGVAGLLIARWGSQALLWTLSYPDDPLLLDLSWDAKLAAFAVSITLACALLFGLAPAFGATQISLSSAMNNGVTTGRPRSKFMNAALVVAQVALSVAVLASAGLLARTLQAFLTQDLGYDPKGVVTAQATWQAAGESPQPTARVAEEILKAFRSLPGVTSASASWGPASSSHGLPQLTVPGPGGSERRMGSYPTLVSSEFFKTRRTPLLAGRDFNDGDTGTSPPVAILSEALAKALFGAVNPVGLTFREDDQDGSGRDHYVEVIGVVRDIQYRRPDYGPLLIFYRPVSQCGCSTMVMAFYEIRIAGAFAESSKRLENAGAAIDSRVSLKFGLLSNVMDGVLRRNRAMALIATTFGLFVALLAMIGVYGVTSHATAERTREIGIRIALGAERRDVFGMLLGEMMRVVCVGVVFGLAAVFPAAQIIQGAIWGVKTTDPLSLSFAICLMLLIAGIAAFLPARRAMRVDPMVALRYE
jgi:putative ABC transport system permease protein